MTVLKMNKCSFVEHKYFGPLYIVHKFKDSSGVVYVGINGVDGVSYNFNAIECTRILTAKLFNSLSKGRC